MRRLSPRILVVLAALLAAAFTQSGQSHAAPPPLLIEPVVWQFDRDYPDYIPGDVSLPIDTIYVKTHDETDWMATYDSNPNAISGPESVEDIVEVYASQGIETVAWFVPKGTDYARQLEMAKQVIDSGVTALYADLEPYQGFCYLDCKALADNFWKPLRAERPNARLGVIYDPRPWWWAQSATSDWFSVADAALPMCYWESYTGQVPWMDPAGCVTQARADLATLSPNRHLDYIPMVQGDSTAERIQQSFDAAVRAESTRVSLWRRGVVSMDSWNMMYLYVEPDGPHCALKLIDGCLVREASQPQVYVIQGGAKFWIQSPEDFGAMGFNFRDVQVVPLGMTHDIPNAPPNGTLLSEFGASNYHVVYAGARFEVANADEAAALGLDPANAKVIPPHGLIDIPAVPLDYTRLKSPSDALEYVVYAGARIPLDSDGLAALVTGGRSSQSPFLIADAALAAIPLAEVKSGDADCDGSVGVLDVVLVLMSTTGVPQAGICTHITGDTNCDGARLATDALLILRFASGDPAETPEGCPPIGESEPAALPTPPPANTAGDPTPDGAPTLAPTSAPTTDTPPPPEPTSEPPTAVPTVTPDATPTPTDVPPTPERTPLPATSTPTPTPMPTP